MSEGFPTTSDPQRNSAQPGDQMRGTTNSTAQPTSQPGPSAQSRPSTMPGSQYSPQPGPYPAGVPQPYYARGPRPTLTGPLVTLGVALVLFLVIPLIGCVLIGMRIAEPASQLADRSVTTTNGQVELEGGTDYLLVPMANSEDLLRTVREARCTVSLNGIPLPTDSEPPDQTPSELGGNPDGPGTIPVEGTYFLAPNSTTYEVTCTNAQGQTYAEVGALPTAQLSAFMGPVITIGLVAVVSFVIGLPVLIGAIVWLTLRSSKRRKWDRGL